jgi:hypothetical protein
LHPAIVLIAGGTQSMQALLSAELVSKDGMGDLNWSQFVDETVIDELEREGFFESLKK